MLTDETIRLYSSFKTQIKLVMKFKARKGILNRSFYVIMVRLKKQKQNKQKNKNKKTTHTHTQKPRDADELKVTLKEISNDCFWQEASVSF